MKLGSSIVIAEPLLSNNFPFSNQWTSAFKTSVGLCSVNTRVVNTVHNPSQPNDGILITSPLYILCEDSFPHLSTTHIILTQCILLYWFPCYLDSLSYILYCRGDLQLLSSLKSLVFIWFSRNLRIPSQFSQFYCHIAPAFGGEPFLEGYLLRAWAIYRFSLKFEDASLSSFGSA